MIDLRCGDCLKILPTLAAGSIDAVVTDPPYGLGFMGATWDGVVPPAAVWSAVRDAMKPGGYLLAFGGTRTYHRLVCAIEDAGFEIRDCLIWLYGTGFPKGKACLKPGWEPIVLARRPGRSIALNIDECRIGVGLPVEGGNGYKGSAHTRSGGWQRLSHFVGKPERTPNHTNGRWPANVVLDAEAGAMLDEQAGTRTSGKVASHDMKHGSKSPSPRVYGGDFRDKPLTGFGDSGGASRFFYCPKASRRDRNDGCEGMPTKRCGTMEDDAYEWPDGRDVSRQNHHPTVKPTDLMRWLVRLVTQPGDVVLDPFMGSGSTGKAAIAIGRSFVGIERERRYVTIARRRIKAALAEVA